MKVTNESARWLWLGVLALAAAGIFAVVLLMARTPQLGALKDFFDVALVVHVDLSVLMWFLCVGGMGWSALIARSKLDWPYWQQASFALTAIATALMAFSPLTKPWHVIKSNYIPVLDNDPFQFSLLLLMAGMAVMLIQLVVAYARASVRRKLSYVELGWLYAGVMTGLAIAGFFIAGYWLPASPDRDAQFDTLFWAGGHMLQFAYTALMMAAWLLLLEEVTKKALKQFSVFIAFALLGASAVYSVASFALYPGDLLSVNAHMSKAMVELLGIGPILLAGLIVGPLLKHLMAAKKWFNAYSAALVMSLVLFAAGGVLGMLIHGQNVTIPAHYHGAIVGVTLALMGTAYAMLPKFGYPNVSAWRLARWQPVLYGVGQMIHIGALAYSGGYGVLRKTPDALASLPMNLKISLGIMGIGGAIAILGGLLFVVVMARAFLQQRRGKRA